MNANILEPEMDMDPSATILLLSTDRLLFKSMSAMLPEARYRLDQRSELEHTTPLIADTSPSMVLVDTSLTQGSAARFCRNLRETYAGVIVVLAEHYDEWDELSAFESGADDYVRKSVHVQILMARIDRLLKLTRPPEVVRPRPIAIGSIVVDPTRREVFVDDRQIRLTSIQFDLLWHLANNCGRVVTREDLNRLLYNREYNGIDRSIDVYVSRLRQKLGDDPSQPVYLKTVRGVGYLFADLR